MDNRNQMGKILDERSRLEIHQSLDIIQHAFLQIERTIDEINDIKSNEKQKYLCNVLKKDIQQTNQKLAEFMKQFL